MDTHKYKEIKYLTFNIKRFTIRREEFIPKNGANKRLERLYEARVARCWIGGWAGRNPLFSLENGLNGAHAGFDPITATITQRQTRHGVVRTNGVKHPDNKRVHRRHHGSLPPSMISTQGKHKKNLRRFDGSHRIAFLH